MHALIIAQYYPPDLGGSATRAYNMAKGLTQNGCSVTVVTAFPHYPHGNISRKYRWKPFEIEWIEDIKIIRSFIIPLESKGLVRRILLFITFILSSLFSLPIIKNVDVIWAANPDVISIIPALIYGKIKRIPVTSNVDDLILSDLYDLNILKKGLITNIFRLVTRFCYIKSKIITPISPAYVETISNDYGINKNKIHVMPGGVDLNIFRPREVHLGESITSSFTVLYSGAFSIAYNFNQVLFAAKILDNNKSGVKFVLQGKGELYMNILTKIEELSLNNVVLIDKLLTRKEVAEFISKADVLIQPLGDYGKPHMGISTKLYEYQAVGKPILCCSSGTPGYYIKETESGLIIKPGNHEDLAKAIMYLKNNVDISKIMGENGRKYVEDNLSLEVIGLEMKKQLIRLKPARSQSI